VEGLNKNRVALLIAVIIMLLIAAGSGYRLQLGAAGLIFERTSTPIVKSP
jgi:hypothetical protein